MIMRRLTARLREENWVAVTIDFVIVVIGVFLGVQASNWNQGRLERREIDQVLVQMQPELLRLQQANAVRLRYYAITKRFAREALAGWADDPSVTDRDFVVAAYQASQITAARGDSPLKQLLDPQDTRKIDDQALRWALLRVVNFNYDAVSASAMQTRYREDVRQILPDDIQDRIRQDCGDRALPNGIPVLPPTCPTKIAPARASAGAAELRRHPELARELQFHLSQAANFELNTGWLDAQVTTLEKLLESRFGKPRPIKV